MRRSPGWRALVALAVLFMAQRARADALAAKADAFLSAIHARHLSPQGLFLYNVDLRTIGGELASGAYPAMADGPTFNGLSAGSACAPAEATSGEERARALADAAAGLSGLELLMDVTGVRGLLARTARRAPPVGPDQSDWHAGSGRFAGWFWRGDVSQDQYANGLVPAVGLCRRLFAERSRRLVVDAEAHLVTHRFQLVDPDGKRTTYGDLSPTSGLGWNGIGQLTGYAIVALVAALDPNDAQSTALRDRLRDRDRMVSRARFTNARIFGITDYSNDLMSFDLYRVLLPLALETGDPAEADLRAGLWRSWLRVRDDHNPYFALVFCELEPESCPARLLAEVHDALADFPAEKRKIGGSAELAALPRRWLPARKREDEARELVPMRLRPATSFEWKSSPYRVTDVVDPSTEYTGLDYLVAYWLYDALCRTRGDCPR